MVPKLDGVNRARLRKAAIGFGVFLVLLGLLGGLLAPRLLRPTLENLLTEKLHRPVKLAELSINPYALSVTARGLSIGEKEGTGELAGLDELYLNVSGSSLFRMAPVVSEVLVSGPRVHLVRKSDNSYNISDLIEEFLNKPDDGPPPSYALHNIRLSGGKFEFEDKPTGAVHKLTDLEVGVPFVSNLPSQVEVFVQPYLKTKVNGSPLAFGGKVRPFSKEKVADLSLDLADVDLTRYFPYVPVRLAISLPSAKLDAKLKLSFEQPQDKPARISLSGEAALKQLDVRHKDGAPMLKLAALKVVLKGFDFAANKLDLDKVTLEGPELAVRRLKDGSLSVSRLVLPAPKAGHKSEKPVEKATNKPAVKEAAKEVPKPAPLALSLGEFHLTGGKLVLTDEMPEKPVQVGLENLEAKVAKLTLSGVELKGRADLSLGFKALRLGVAGEKQTVFGLDSLSVAGAADGDKREILLSDITAAGGRVFAVRQADGVFSPMKLIPRSAGGEKAAPAKAAVAPSSAPAWTVSLRKLSLEGWNARLEDLATAGSLPLEVRNLALKAENLTTGKGTPAKLDLKGEVGKRGSVAVNGSVGLAPLSGKLDLSLKAVDLVPLQAYFLESFNVTLSKGQLEGKGSASFDGPAKAGQAFRAGFKGSLGVGDLALVDKGNSSDLLKWKSLRFSGINAAVGGKLPFELSLSEIALGDFFARLVVNPDGTLALRQLKKHKDGEAPPAVAKAEPAAAAATPTPAPAETGKASVADTAELPYRIKVDKVSLNNGRINFSDYFIKPNYSANLRDMQGSVTGLSSEAGSTAEVKLDGTVDGTAPVSISGRTNPLSKQLYLDLRASAKGMELAGLSPYAARYAGYAIEKGKLSMDIHYFIENRKLQADNHLFLDQLTFGQKIDSPDATKLPVLLAVALLKNSRGEIDINLPIGGSLDDPEFSVGGIVVKVIVNLLVKAVTAPFALLGNLFGGGEELGWLEFEPGRAAIAAGSEDKLNKLAKALQDRPALKLEVTGRADPASDKDGLRQNALERKIKAQKLKETVKKGEESGSLADVMVSAAERPKYLALAYKEESFAKPKNLIGFAKDLPPAEMERLILENVPTNDEALQRLAAARAKAVADWMVRKGQVPVERVFVVSGTAESKPDEARAKAKLSRADFSLK